MKKNCTVVKEIDYYKESIELLFRIVNNNSYSNLKINILNRIDVKLHKKVSKQFDKLSKIQEYVKKHTDMTNPDIQYYFVKFAFNNLCLAKILYHSIAHSLIQGNKGEMKSFIIQSMDKWKKDNTLEFILEDTELKISKSDNRHKVPFTDRISNLECEPAQKWQLLELIEHPSEHVDKLFNILDKTIVLIKKYQSIFEELKNESSEYWEDYFKENAFSKLIDNFYNIKENSYPSKPAFIRAQIIPCNQVVFWGNDENAGDYHILDVGILFDCNFKATKRQLTTQDLCNRLKLLSDPSKFEILRFIKDKKAYGQEIANELHLTTATISHHMNALMKLGLINLEKVDNKVYYQTNKQAISNLLEEAKNRLLQED